MKSGIKVKDLLKIVQSFETISTEESLNKVITSPELSRLGLALLDYYPEFPYERVLVYGKMEYNKLLSDPDLITQEHIYNEKTPLIVFSHGFRPDDEFVKRAMEKNITIMLSNKNTTKIIAKIHTILRRELAHTIRMHGVLLNTLGVGVLIKGKSGIGKSEVALELIQKGSYLVADDSVEIRKIDEDFLEGSSPSVLQNRMEIRGIGIVDIQKLYGVTSVLTKNKIDLIINLTEFTNQEDRLGNKMEYEEILGIEVRKISLPVLKGRSIANMVEVAVANYQLKTEYSYDSTEEFFNDLNNELLGKNNE